MYQILMSAYACEPGAVVNMALGGWFRQRWLENILSINSMS